MMRGAVKDRWSGVSKEVRKYPNSMHVLRRPRGAISSCSVLEIPIKDVRCAAVQIMWDETHLVWQI